MSSPGSSSGTSTDGSGGKRVASPTSGLCWAPPKKRSRTDPLVGHGKHFGRTIRTFCHVQTIVTNGLSRTMQLELGRISEQELERTDLVEQRLYAQLLELSPGLEERLNVGSEEELHYIANMASVSLITIPSVLMDLQITKGIAQARSDDTKSLKSAVVDWITPPNEVLSPAIPRNVKHGRGYHHERTGWLLCPVNLNWEDPKIRRDLASGQLVPAGDLWPRFIYRNNDYNENDVWDGLLRSSILVKAFKHVFTSPSSVDAAEGFITTTRSCNARIHGMTAVTIASIAYIATQVRFALMSSNIFSRTDQMTDSEGFYNLIVDLLEDPDEKDEVTSLLKWWNQQIFPALVNHVRPIPYSNLFRKVLDGKGLGNGARSEVGSKPVVGNIDKTSNLERLAPGQRLHSLTAGSSFDFVTHAAVRRLLVRVDVLSLAPPPPLCCTRSAPASSFPLAFCFNGRRLWHLSSLVQRNSTPCITAYCCVCYFAWATAGETLVYKMLQIQTQWYQFNYPPLCASITMPSHPHPLYSSMQCPDVGVILTHFLRQIENRHATTASQKPALLHWVASTGGLGEFGWPSDEQSGERIPPEQWESLRRTHHFRGPCCLCAFLDDKDYTESRIAISEVILASSGENGALVNGDVYRETILMRRYKDEVIRHQRHVPILVQYVAFTRADTGAAFPVPAQELAHIPDIDKSFKVSGGLFQVMNKAVVRGKGRLVSITPEEAQIPKADLIRDLSCGISESRFWSIFVQCLLCKEVIFRDTMAVSHHCDFQKKYPEGRPQPYHRRRRPSALQAYLESIPCDMPQDSQFCSLYHSSPTPTEVAQDAAYPVWNEELAEEVSDDAT
ncbi:hypothetical protein NMY22_g4128 [Coprinellus aureogranulatus]|nr:hypothetical protein NMY22_g4128 [Coprinellus aureogranulatus]